MTACSEHGPDELHHHRLAQHTHAPSRRAAARRARRLAGRPAPGAEAASVRARFAAGAPSTGGRSTLCGCAVAGRHSSPRSRCRGPPHASWEARGEAAAALSTLALAALGMRRQHGRAPLSKIPEPHRSQATQCV